MTHRVEVEYGNVGVDFKFIPREGFGWMNASYQVGLGYMDRSLRRALGAVMDPGKVFEVRHREMESRKQNMSLVTQPPDVTTHLLRPRPA
jgi:alpha,alpha-trehalase